MKTTWMVLLAAVGLIWSASWVSACDGCGCKVKAKGEAVKAAATEAPAKCVACPHAQKGEDGKEVTCPGNCKADCCKGVCKTECAKGDAAKCADCPKACKAKTCGAAAKTSDAAGKTCGAPAKTCGAAAKTCGAATAN